MSRPGETGPLVSVIVPAFNAEATLAEALGSALAQSYRNIELIVVDDGSTDRTASIAAEAAAGDGRVILLRTEHGGGSSARNLALARARGDYVAPLDADDLWHPLKLERQVAAALGAETPPGFVYAFMRRIDVAGRVLGAELPHALRGHVLHRLIYRNFVGGGGELLIRRAAMIEAGGYDERLKRADDYLLQLRIARRHPIEVVPEYLVGYRLTPGSLSSNRDEVFRAWRALRRLFREDCPRTARQASRWAHAKKCFQFGDLMIHRRRPLAALRMLLTAFLLDPRGTLLHARQRLAWHRRRRSPPPPPGPLFADNATDAKFAAPFEDPRIQDAISRLETRRFAKLAVLDEAYAERRARPADSA